MLKRIVGKRVWFSLSAVVIVIVLVVLSSLYAKATLNPNELSHFFVPFPAGRVVRPQTVQDPSGGSIFVRPVTINVDERGVLKKWLNPGIEGLSTHWLNNIDSVPHRIGLMFTDIELEVDWDVHAGIPWNEETRQFEVAVAPGESVPDLGIDWLFHFPEELQSQDTWYAGNLVVYDADSGEDLTTIPVKFQQGGGSW